MSSKRKGRARERSPEPGLQQQLQAILSRLNALEDNSSLQQAGPSTAIDGGAVEVPAIMMPGDSTLQGPREPASVGLSPPPSLPPSVVTATATERNCVLEVTDKIANAINAITQVRSTSFYISSFDPSLHNFDVWCDEVDHVRILNGWDDRECLARIGNCLKGDARVWLNEWVTNDRSWYNFKTQFKALCPRRIDIANILFDVMKTDSDNYPTYAEYARRSLLRLRIVTGLSEMLISAIVIRGITDPQIRAAATNANLLPEDLVSFLSIYVKPVQPNNKPRFIANRNSDIRGNNNITRKRERVETKTKCFNCGNLGHRHYQCPKRARLDTTVSIVSPSTASSNNENDLSNNKLPCTYCKKLGHKISDCFAKQRADSRGKPNVNFCRELDESSYKKNDIATGVIQGIPVDILIDSGSTISLISESVVNHFQCNKIPSYRALRGIGSEDVESTSCTTLTVEFSEITLEVDFHIVPSRFMNTPVIVGTDVLNRDGVTYVRTRGEQRLTRVDRVLVVESNATVPINTTLDGPDKKRLLDIINQFSENLITGTANTTVKTGTMRIQLKNDAPVVYRPYKMSHSEKLRVREIISDLKEKNIIRESQSEFSSPILLVKKRDGSDRMCVDYRALNANTYKDRYPLPLIDDHIDRLGKSVYFTSLDMATGFHQIPMDPESIHMTAFVTPEGHFEYLKMPYGLSNAPVVYQKIIANTLSSFIAAGKVYVYIDDVLIPSMTIEEGLETLREVLQTLTDAGFAINLKKCTFLAREIEYLGRTISNGQVSPSKHKVEALVNSPVPTNIKQVRQFMGLAGYFRRYIPGYSVKTACISNLLRKGVQFKWGEAQETVRRDIIERLSTEPTLSIFDPSLPTEVHTDASSLGYGAVLLQTHESGHKRPVAYYSKATQGAEPRYHSYELETLAVVRALQHFRHYLIGIHFKVVTDCNALKLTQRKKDLLPRVARWWVYLQDYDFELEYRKGTALSHADYLSRNPVNVCQVRRPTNWAQVAQAADTETQELVEKLNSGQLDCNRYVQQNNILYYKLHVTGEDSPRLLCYVPKGHRLSLLRIFHDEHHHIGFDKTVELILKHFWFPGLRSFAKKYIQHCIVCLSHKNVPRQPHQPIVSWNKPNMPFETVHSDVLGPLPESNGYKYVVVIVDSFTKYCLLYPIYRQDSNELRRVFEIAISLFGAPKLLVVDRGRMYESTVFVEWVKGMGSDIYFITPDMHQSNGQAERYCRTVLNMIRVESNFRQEQWSNVLWKLQLTLNITTQKSTKYSPLNLLIGSEAVTPVIRLLLRDVACEGSSPNREAMRDMARQRAAELLDINRTQQDARVNERRRPPRGFAVGDVVFVNKGSQATGKLDSGMRGPYRVIKVLPHGRYDMKLLAGSYGKTTQAAAEFMTLWRGEWTPETCSAFFESEYYSYSLCVC